MTAAAAIAGRRFEAGVVLAAAALAAIVLGLMPNAAAIFCVVTLALGVLVAWVAWQDAKTFTISDAAIIAIALVAFAARWAAARIDLEPALQTLAALAIDAGLPGGLLLLFREVFYRRKGYDGLGFGDVKLAAAGGLLVGVPGFAWALFAASLAGLCVVALGQVSSRALRGRTEKFALGTVLAPALWIVFVAEQMPPLHALIEG